MTKIDRSSIWQGLINRTEAGKALQRKQASAGASAGLDRGAAGTDELGFDQRVRIGLAAIDPVSANVAAKALEVFVNAALLDAFGTEIQNDPEYAHLLHDVLEALQLSPDYQAFTEFALTELNHAHK